jgi:hypothetical protein
MNGTRLSRRFNSKIAFFIPAICLMWQPLFAQSQENLTARTAQLPQKKAKSKADGKSQFEKPIGPTSNNTDMIEDMPDSQLLNTYKAELYAIKKNEDAQRKSAEINQTAQESEAQIAREIAVRKSKVEMLKLSQEKINADIAATKAEIVDYQNKFEKVQTEYEGAEQNHEAFLGNLEAERKSLESLKNKYEEALLSLNKRSEASKKAINSTLINVQKLKSELASIETSIESASALRASLQADEMKAQTEWVVAKTQIAERNTEKEKALADAVEARKRFQLALKNSNQAQAELVVAQRNQVETSNRVSTEIRKLDESTFNAQKNKSIADANKIRLEAESDKMQNYIAMVKKSNSDALSEQKQSEDKGMNAQLALEVARSELGQQLSIGDRRMATRERHESEARSIASVEKSYEVFPGGKTWVTSKTCQIHEHPRSASNPLGEVTSGQKIVAAVAFKNWVKVKSDGKNAYVKSDCGSFE